MSGRIDHRAMSRLSLLSDAVAPISAGIMIAITTLAIAERALAQDGAAGVVVDLDALGGGNARMSTASAAVPDLLPPPALAPSSGLSDQARLLLGLPPAPPSKAVAAPARPPAPPVLAPVPPPDIAAARPAAVVRPVVSPPAAVAAPAPGAVVPPPGDPEPEVAKAAPAEKPEPPAVAPDDRLAVVPARKPAAPARPTPEPAPAAAPLPEVAIVATPAPPAPAAAPAPPQLPVAEAPTPPQIELPAAVEPAAGPQAPAAAEVAPEGGDGAAAPQLARLPDADAAADLSLEFAPDSADLDTLAEDALAELAERMSGDEVLRLQLLSYAAGTAQTASRARRLSLSRALAVRSYLIDHGVRSTRMDVRALGNSVEQGPADRVDIVVLQP